MQVIQLTDSVVVTTSRETCTISKVHPLFSRLEQVFDDESAFYKVLATPYTTIYLAYDQEGLLVIKSISADKVSVRFPTEPNHTPFNIDIATHLGTFITYDELINYYPEYFL